MLGRHRSLLLPGQLLDHLSVIPQIDLRPNDKTWDTRTMVVHLWDPFLPHVLEGWRRRYTEANKEDIGLGVRQWPETVIILLPFCVEVMCERLYEMLLGWRLQKDTNRRCRKDLACKDLHQSLR